MKLKSKVDPGTCAASRCTQPSDGGQFCAKHSGVKSQDLTVIKSELEPLRDELTSWLELVSSVDLTDAGELFGKPVTGVQALEILREEARRTVKRLDDQRTSITKPILDAKRAADLVFAPQLDLAKAILNCCNKRLSAYVQTIEAAREQALQAMGAGQESKALVAAVHAPPALTMTKARITNDYEITDVNLVPREFLTPDAVKIKAYLVAKDWADESIPGVRTVQKVSVSA